MMGIKADYLQTFLVGAGRTIGERKTHTTVPDGIEGPVTKRPGLERHVYEFDES